jgi:large subunit ribosomal protein L10
LALTREKKETRINEFRDLFSRSAVIIIFDYSALKVSESTELRKQLREANACLKAGKNTLFNLAASGTQAEVLADHFAGQKAMVIGFEDPVAPAKVIMNFVKDKEKMKIAGGVFSGKFLDPDAVKALSELPSREVLIAKLLSVFISVPTGLVQVLSGILRKFLYALKAIEDKKQ